jgi:soluble lytic murein transglycosylase-like protein
VPAGRDHLRPILKRYAAENGLPADLVMALAWKESSWRVGAVSKAGAVGVMQLMPSTVTFVSRDLMGLRSNLDPHNGTANIRMGTRFFAHLVKVYDGSHRRALIAYNQGVTALRTRGSYPGAERFADSVMALRAEFKNA